MPTVFEHYVTGRDKNDEVYVKLEAGKDSPLELCIPLDIEVTENFSTGSFVVTFNVLDGGGSLMHYNILDFDDTFILTFGNAPDKSETSAGMKVADVEQITGVGGKTESVRYKITMVHSGWNSLMNTKKNRSWKDTKFSDVVNELAGECGYGKLDVKETDEEQELIIQPYFSNIKMLRYIQKYAKSSDYDDIYDFGVNIKGEFFFKTVSDILEENQPKAASDGLPLMTMQGVHQNEGERAAAKSANQNVPPHFFFIEPYNPYMTVARNNGGSFAPMHYDFEMGEFKKDTVKYDEVNAYMISEWGPLKKSHHDGSLSRFYTGRDIESKELAKKEMSNVINSSHIVKIMTEGTYALFIGDMIEVLIPKVSEIKGSPVSEFYSGFYIVIGVNQKFHLSNNRYFTDLILMRHGYDGKKISGHIQSSLGRFV